MFLEAIKNIFGPASAASDTGEHSAPDVNPVHLAACALLLEVAHADGEFSPDEKKYLEDALARHFELPAEAGQRLLELAEAERRAAVDQYRFTSVLSANYDIGQKMVLAEVMWGLVLADGKIAEHEHYLTRKIANLLDLEAGYLSTAKKAAAEGATRRQDG